MPTPTAREYFADVESIAADIFAEYGDNEDEYPDAIHEACDGSQWVIYTYRARKVLEWSGNDHAGPDSMGWDDFTMDCTGWSDLFTRGAYFAMYADVFEKVGEMLINSIDGAA